MLILTLFDTGWELTGGLSPAPFPDGNVTVRLSLEQRIMLKEAREKLISLIDKCPDCSKDAYFVFHAPAYEGELYKNDRLTFKSYNRIIAVTKDSIMYVLEDAYRGLRLVYDLSIYL